MSAATPGVSAGNVICVCERLGYARWGVGHGVGGLTKNTYCHLVVTTMTPGRGGGLEGDEGGIKRREKDRTRPIVSHFFVCKCSAVFVYK